MISMYGSVSLAWRIKIELRSDVVLFHWMETSFQTSEIFTIRAWWEYATVLSMIRNWQNRLLNKGKIGAILMDLSKAFDCLSHKLLIAKLEAYGIGTQSLRFLYSYFTNRKHRVRINSSFSEWLELLLGVPQGSVLGPILFNIFINDLLFTVNGSSICNFADDNTLYVCDSSLDNVLSRLNADMRSILAWFECNSLIANPEKFQLIFPGTVNSNIAINIGTNVVMSVVVILSNYLA